MLFKDNYQLDIAKQYSLNNATIGIVTVLKEEFAAVITLLNCLQKIEIDKRVYRIGTVQRSDNSGTHIVVACRLDDMGNTTAATRATQLLNDCENVKTIIMCGISGAVPSPSKADEHVRLGDIVVPNKRGVVDYGNEKIEEKFTKIREQWSLNLSRLLLHAAQDLETDELFGERPWEIYINRAINELSKKEPSYDWSRPGDDKDILREFTYKYLWNYVVKIAECLHIRHECLQYKIIAHPNDINRKEGSPKVFHGVIASANKLLKNRRNRDYLKKRYDAKAVEMEGAGISCAAFESDANYFVVRGTVDYCNSYKNDIWHKYASIIAAAYTRALLEITPLLFLGEDEKTYTRSSASHEIVRPNIKGDKDKNFNQFIDEKAIKDIDLMNKYIDTWEFDKAYSMVDEKEKWLEKYNSYLSKNCLVDSYKILARIELIKANHNKLSNGSLDLTRVDYFIRKAKSV